MLMKITVNTEEINIDLNGCFGEKLEIHNSEQAVCKNLHSNLIFVLISMIHVFFSIKPGLHEGSNQGNKIRCQFF